MKKNWSKALAVMVSAALVLGGCAGGQGGNETASTETASAETTISADKESSSQADETGTAQETMTAGTYQAEAQGNGSVVTVELTVSEHEILEVTVDASGETSGLGDKAAERLAAEIKEKQTLGLDAVTGATVTSTAVLTAAEDCLRQAGADMEYWTRAAEKENAGVVESIETDIVVIGAGGSGMSAAVTAAEAGAKVVVLEKTAIAGGTTANGGGFFAADSAVSRDVGHEPLDTDYIFELYMEEMDWMADANLVKDFLETSKTTADWLIAHGLEIHKMENAVQQTHGEGTNGYHKYDDFTKTSSVFTEILSSTEGVTVYYETPAVKLLTDGDRKVTGVSAVRADGSVLEVSAGAVIIATGGFVGNQEMVKDSLNGVSVNPSGYNTNVGDGILMAQELGAATRSMSAMVNHTFKIEGAANVKGEYDPMDLVHGTGALAYIPVNVWLNQDGVRFANEDIVYDRMLSGNAMVTNGNYGWFLYNQSLIDTLETKGAAAAGMYDKISMGPWTEYTPMNEGWNQLNDIVNEMADDVLVVKAQTLEELAEKTDMDQENLKTTMELYNTDAQNGRDSRYGKRKEHMFDMSEGPYYAIKVTVNNLCTVGGLRINSHMNVVLDDPENGYPAIENLYAAGADASAIYSDHYAHTIEGAAQGWAYNSGRLAGKEAVKHVLGIEPEL